VVNGKLLWFNPAKGYGFIRTEDGERLQLDQGGIVSGEPIGDRCSGTRVTFERIESPEGPRACSVAVVIETAPRRARLRHSR
jgi:cold shock protein